MNHRHLVLLNACSSTVFLFLHNIFLHYLRKRILKILVRRIPYWKTSRLPTNSIHMSKRNPPKTFKMEWHQITKVMFGRIIPLPTPYTPSFTTKIPIRINLYVPLINDVAKVTDKCDVTESIQKTLLLTGSDSGVLEWEIILPSFPISTATVTLFYCVQNKITWPHVIQWSEWNVEWLIIHFASNFVVDNTPVYAYPKRGTK